MVAVIDYGVGNLGSVSNALVSLGGKVRVTQKASDLKKADKIVLPGVGAFRDAMDALAGLELIDTLKEEIAGGKTYLGICLGLELLFEKSSEGGSCKGLGVLKGDVIRFGERNGLKVPHMGWNQAEIKNKDCPLFRDIEDNAFFYFLHSYYVKPLDKEIVAVSTDYGCKFTSMIWKDNIYAVQFHPEKSQEIGLRFLNNFMSLR